MGRVPGPGSLGWVSSLAPGRQVRLGPRPRSLGGVRSPAQVPRCGQVPGPGPHVGSGPRPWIPGSGWVGFPAQAPGGVVSPAQSPGRVSSLALGPQISSAPRPRSPGRVGSPALGPRVGSGRVGSLVPGPRVGSGLWPGSPGRAGTPAPVQRVMSGPRTGSPARAPAAPSAATCWWEGGTAGSRAPRMRHGAHGRPLPPSPGGTGVLQAAGCRACAVLITSLFLLLCNFLRS